MNENVTNNLFDQKIGNNLLIIHNENNSYEKNDLVTLYLKNNKVDSKRVGYTEVVISEFLKEKNKFVGKNTNVINFDNIEKNFQIRSEKQFQIINLKQDFFNDYEESNAQHKNAQQYQKFIDNFIVDNIKKENTLIFILDENIDIKSNEYKEFNSHLKFHVENQDKIKQKKLIVNNENNLSLKPN